MQKDIEQLNTLSQRLKSQSDIAMQEHGAFIGWATQMRGEIAERTADTVKAVQMHAQHMDDQLAGLILRSKDLQNRLLGTSAPDNNQTLTGTNGQESLNEPPESETP